MAIAFIRIFRKWQWEQVGIYSVQIKIKSTFGYSDLPPLVGTGPMLALENVRFE